MSRRRPLPSVFLEPFAGARVLEIGGPSALFGKDGLLPVYPRAKTIDGVQPSALTTWHDLDPTAGYVLNGERSGDLHITDDIDLSMLADHTYDAVISSHVIEHIADPLRALAAWRRVCKSNGAILIVAPHMAGTFDHRRPLTSVQHMIDDSLKSTGEDDLTHLEESLRHHDGDRDIRGVDDPEFVRELSENARTRLMHHHTFITSSLIELLTVAGVQVHGAEARLPHDIFAIGQWVTSGDRIDNERHALEASRSSPFRADRRAARRLAATDRSGLRQRALSQEPPAASRSVQYPDVG